jgi:hypothetical protein
MMADDKQMPTVVNVITVHRSITRSALPIRIVRLENFASPHHVAVGSGYPGPPTSAVVIISLGNNWKARWIGDFLCPHMAGFCLRPRQR